MKKVFSLLLALLLCSFLVVPLSLNLACAVDSTTSEPKTITVPTDANSIAQALTDANAGDTIFVQSGIYYENLVIDKSISLVGQGADSTELVGDGNVAKGGRAVINITAPNVTITGFTIQSVSYSESNLRASGISINADGANITENNIINTYYGVFCSSQSGVTIAYNNITNSAKEGIRWCGGSQDSFIGNIIINSKQSAISLEGFQHVIANNTMINNGRALGLAASYCLVFGNIVDDDLGSGFYIGGSYNTICANTLSNGDYGFHFTFTFANPQENLLYLNNLYDNQYNVYFADFATHQNWTSQMMGNYWGDYTGTDSNGDGIGDTPYQINNLNNDTYPLMEPINITAQTMPEPILPSVPDTDSTVAWWHFDSINDAGVTPDETGQNPAVIGTTDESAATYTLVEGESGSALQFDGIKYAYVPVSPSLTLREEFSFEAVLKLEGYKAVDYNVIYMEAARTTSTYPDRIIGFAVNGNPDSTIPLGALRGFMLDENGVFNEIVSTEQVVQLDQWTNVVFTRSLSNGLHLYINDKEVAVNVTSGIQNPQGLAAEGGEIYIGHDSYSTIDELGVRNYVLYQQGGYANTLLLAILSGVVGALVVFLIVLLRYKRKDY
ncbi:MAG: right-handed parallel beta-helix repeat-containing protein [Candidatus Bathyarchaeota archaeon]|nr:right-handed parallel beta-helix repeat-containing protein [Candidatus Bathyarchaeota archaeon]